MFTLSWVLGAAGAVLILVGAIGGGFSFSGSMVPRVGAVGRVVSLVLGVVLVLGGLTVDPSLAPAAPEARVATQPATQPAAPTVDEQVVELLSRRSSFAGFSGAELVQMAHTECEILRGGGSARDIITVATDNGISYSDAVYQLQVSVAAYCSDNS